MSVNNPSTIITWRKGTIDDPYIDITETLKVVNNFVVLSEIPDEFTHLSIPTLIETHSAVGITATKYFVDYQKGIVYVHSSLNGTMLNNISYKGRGIVKYFANRIYVQNENNPDLGQNLQDVINNSQEGITALSSVIAAKDAADVATTNANAATVSANTMVTNTAHKGAYNPATTYQLNNVIEYNGSSYMNILACTGIVPTNTTNWKLIGSGLSWHGTYSAVVAYLVNDIVVFNGSVYLCIQNTTAGTDPNNTSFWSVLVSSASFTNPIVDNSLTIRNNTATSKYILQYGTSGGLEIIFA